MVIGSGHADLAGAVAATCDSASFVMTAKPPESRVLEQTMAATNGMARVLRGKGKLEVRMSFSYRLIGHVYAR